MANALAKAKTKIAPADELDYYDFANPLAGGRKLIDVLQRDLDKHKHVYPPAAGHTTGLA